MAGDPDHNGMRPQPVEAIDATSRTRPDSSDIDAVLHRPPGPGRRRSVLSSVFLFGAAQRPGVRPGGPAGDGGALEPLDSAAESVGRPGAGESAKNDQAVVVRGAVAVVRADVSFDDIQAAIEGSPIRIEGFPNLWDSYVCEPPWMGSADALVVLLRLSQHGQFAPPP